MANKIEVLEITRMESNILNELTELLMDVVDDGASIGFLPPLSRMDAIQYWQDVIQPGVVLLIARLDNATVGTIQLHLAQKQNSNHRAEVAKLMVHPNNRRNGIAKVLMHEIEAISKQENRSLLVLDTRAGDPSNLLYTSYGYIEAGRIPNFAKSANGELHETELYYKEI